MLGVVLLGAHLALVTRHGSEKVFLAVVVADRIVGDLGHFVKHLGTGRVLVEDGPVAVVLEEIAPVQHGQHDLLGRDFLFLL